jgi:phosphoglycerol transferase MdoB-like AlkP superfamily enzyme
MRFVFNSIWVLLLRLLGGMLLLTLCRFLFLLNNFDFYYKVPRIEVAEAFLLGLRFDLSAMLICLSPFIVLHFIPVFHQVPKPKKVLHYFFVTLLTMMFFFNLVDTVYFKFTFTRSTADIFKLVFVSNDMAIVGPSIIIDFWYIIAGWFMLIYLSNKLFIKTSKLINAEDGETKQYIYSILFLLLFVAASAIGVRGGLQYKPLNMLDAGGQQTSALRLNTPYTLINTVGMTGVKSVEYFPGKTGEHFFSAVTQPKETEPFRNDINVVVIIVESLSKEYVGYLNNFKGYTPFLDSLCAESFVFTNAYSNGKKSIEGIPAVLASLPTLMNDPFITSKYNGNQITSIASLLQKKGYTTSFYHGAKNGSMAFNAFAEKAGFENYYGRDEYNNDADYDGNWGIYDEEFLQYFANGLTNTKQPFVGATFTLSSHHPYPIPEKYKGKFPEGELPIHKSVLYADYSLKQFFATASKTEWFNNTIFIITADHTSLALRPFYQNCVGAMSVPIIMYSPALKLKGKSNVVTQQTDIMPALLDLLNYDEPYIAFGKSPFDSTTTHSAFTRFDQLYQIIEGNYVLQFDGNKTINLHDFKNDSLLTNNLAAKETEKQQQLENTLKAFIQDYNHRLINNMTEIK